MTRLDWLKNNGYYDQDWVIHTRSTKFLLPLVGVNEMDIEKQHKNLLINVHFTIKDDKIKIVVVLNTEVIDENIKYWIECQGFNENYERFEYNSEDNDYLLIYNLPEHFRDDFNHFIEGEYSKTSDEYKAVITRIYGFTEDKNDYRPTVYECLYPKDYKRKLMAAIWDVDYKIINEVSVKPNKRYEFFHTLEELKNLEFLV